MRNTLSSYGRGEEIPLTEQREREGKQNLWKRCAVMAWPFCCAAALSVLVIVLIAVSGISVPRGKPVAIEVMRGDGTIAVAKQLTEKKVIRDPRLFRLFATMQGMDDRWRAGRFTLNPGDGFVTICRTLSAPHAGEVKVTIPEGVQVRHIAELLEKQGVCGREEFLAACHSYDGRQAFLRGVPIKERIGGLEGYLFPDTYYFAKDSSPEEVIEIMLRNFDRRLNTPENRRAAEKLGLSSDEVLILASMVESEAQSKRDRRLVAGVFLTRLARGGKLQSCVTVEYAKGIKKPVISLEDTTYDSPYNTYLHTGLPYGPICCPGKESVEAVLHPERSGNYYFVSDGRGKIFFAKTYEEHLANARRLYS